MKSQNWKISFKTKDILQLCLENQLPQHHINWSAYFHMFLDSILPRAIEFMRFEDCNQHKYFFSNFKTNLTVI